MTGHAVPAGESPAPEQIAPRLMDIEYVASRHTETSVFAVASAVNNAAATAKVLLSVATFISNAN